MRKGNLRIPRPKGRPYYAAARTADERVELLVQGATWGILPVVPASRLVKVMTVVTVFVLAGIAALIGLAAYRSQSLQEGVPCAFVAVLVVMLIRRIAIYYSAPVRELRNAFVAGVDMQEIRVVPRPDHHAEAALRAQLLGLVSNRGQRTDADVAA